MQQVKKILLLLTISTNILSMEITTEPIPNGFYFFDLPKEVQYKLYSTLVKNIHHNITTPEEAREYLVNISLELIRKFQPS